MNKWEESITNKSDKRKLLIESSEFVSKIKLSKGLKESLSMQAGKAGTLIVKNIPVTILDRENLNGRIYSTETMRQAIEEAREAMADKQTLGQANEHPESSFVAPTDASHVIINAYIKENIAIVVDGKKERHNVLFTDWEVLNTTHGKDLRALFEAECSFGTSIRGVGELSGKMVENYSFISVDGVGNPSSSTYTRMPVSESVKVELKDPNELKENYTVMSSSTNVVRDLSQAGVLQQQLNANPYGTITKTSTKVDQETDPKTGAQTSITTVEADTEDEVSDLNQAFAMAHKAMTNGISKVNSVTIEANEDEDEQGNKKESVDVADNGLESYVPESTEVKEEALQAYVDCYYEGNFGDKVYSVSISGSESNINYINKELKKYTNKMDYEFEENFPEIRIHHLYEGELNNLLKVLQNKLRVRILDLEIHNPFKKGSYVPEATEINEADNINNNMYKNFQFSIDEHKGSMRITANDGEYLVAEISDCAGRTEDELKILADEILVDLGLIKDSYFTSGFETESVITESTKKKDKEEVDPNEGRQYVLKIKDNDPEMTEGSDDAPEFVAMKGNAIRFTRDPKKALHFTQGMEESGIVHYSNIQKLLADMGYGDQNLEKWYKKTPKNEGIVGGAIGGVAGGVLGNAVAGPLGALGGAASGYSLGSNIGNDLSKKKQESEKLTEDGNTKYSAIIEIVNKGGLPETKSLSVSSVDLDGALKEVSNHWVQQEASNDVNSVNKLTLVDNETQQKYAYDPKQNQLIPENGDNTQQSVQQPIEEPVDDIKVMEPEDVNFESTKESVDGEIEQNDKTLGMDIDDNTHVEKEFNTKAQADAAKAAIELGKAPGSILVTDAVTDDTNWKVCVVFDNLEYDDEELLYNNADPTSGQQVFNGDKPDKIRVTLYPDELNDADNAIEIFALARKKLKDNLGISARPHIYDFNIFDKDEKFNDGIADLPESTNDIKPGWYVANESIGISGPYETYEACMEGLEDYKDKVSVYEVTENDLNEVLFKNPTKPSDDYVEKSLNEEEVVYESSLVPVRFSNIKWDEKDAAYRMFEDIEKDMQIGHINPDVNNANILAEYFESYMNDLNNSMITFDVNPECINESSNFVQEIIHMYNNSEDRKYPRIETAEINLK